MTFEALNLSPSTPSGSQTSSRRTLAHLALLTALLAPSAPARADAAAAECLATIPSGARLAQGAATSYADGSVWVVCRGVSLSIFGDDNTVFIARGGAATIAGSGHRVHAATGAGVVLLGEGNRLSVERGASIQELGPASSRTICSELRLDTLSFQEPRFDSESCGFGAPELPPVDAPVNPLVGAWTVAGVRANGKLLPAEGHIILDASGLGTQSYRVEIDGLDLPQTGTFRWRSDARRLYVDGGSTWTRWVNEPDVQEVEIDLPDGPTVRLRLERREQL
ncbi:MAG: hypothetical protein AAF725_21485 [Acidobacteriota bacterium]